MELFNSNYIYIKYIDNKKQIKASYDDYIKHFKRGSTLDDRFINLEKSTNIYAISVDKIRPTEISRYKIDCMIEKIIELDRSEYILCPMYSSSGRKNIYNDPYEWSDIQIGMTGTLKSNEIIDGHDYDYMASFERELGEELGLVVGDISNVKSYDIMLTNNLSNIKLFDVKISDLDRNDRIIPTSHYRDVRKHKIGGIIHDDLFNVIKFFNGTIVLSSNEDNIIGLAAINIGTIIDRYI